MPSFSPCTMVYATVLVSRAFVDGVLSEVMVIEYKNVTNLAPHTGTGDRYPNAIIIPVMSQGSMSRANLLPVVEWAQVLRGARLGVLSPHRGSGLYTQMTDRVQETFSFAVSSVEEFVQAVSWMKPEQRPHYQLADLTAYWDTYPGASMVVVCFGQKVSGPETLRVAFWYRPQYKDTIMVPTAHRALSSDLSDSNSSGIAYAVLFGGDILGSSIGTDIEVTETSLPHPKRVIGEVVTSIRCSDDLYYRVPEKLEQGILEPTRHPAPNRTTTFFVRRPTPSVKVLPFERIV